MSTVTDYLNKVSNISEFVSDTDGSLHGNLQNLTKLLYEYGQNEKSYKKSNKKSRNLSNNVLVTDDFGADEIWCQIKDHSKTVLSTVDQRTKYRQNERQKMQTMFKQLQNDVNQQQDDTTQQYLDQFIGDDDDDDDDSTDSDNNQQQEQQQDNEWIDIIKDHRSKQLKHKMDKKQEENKPQPQQDNDNDASDDDLDFDSFQKQTDEMEAFINKQWEKEKEMAEDGAFDLLNDNMFERALIFDEENENNNNDNNNNNINNNNNNNNENEDDFAFLNKNKNKNMENDEWNDLFNLPKFPTVSDKDGDNKTDSLQVQESELKNLSKFELEERAIQERIAKLEEENIKQRSWQYQGEVSNNKFTHPNAKRDKNSLLSTYLDFDYSDKLKPQITQDLNEAIENLIITKIKNEQFDDVEKKRDFANAPKIAKRKLVEIQDTKSSMGLAQLYERHYLQQVEEKQNLENDDDFMSTKDAELNKQYEKISRLKSTLFYELDQLIRFHYEPKRAVIADNIKIKTHTNALYLEEMVPFAMTTEMTMTPEQLYRKPRKFGHIKGENEMTKQDRKNKRRDNKKRGKHWKAMRNESDSLRANYDEKFNKHLERIKALNEVRTHAMAAAKKNGFLSGKNVINVEKDETRYTSSKQVFSKIKQYEDNKLKRKLENNESLSVPPEKKRKIKSMMH